MAKNPLEPADFVEEALSAGRIDEAQALLDRWEQSQPPTLDTLSELRYYRPLLGQSQRAIEACKAMIALRPKDAWERISDYLRLGELYVSVGNPHRAWETLQVVLNWNELTDWYRYGLARSTAKLAIDISLAATDNRELANHSLDAALQLIDDGCSTTFDLLAAMSTAAHTLGRVELAERFRAMADRERARIQRGLETPPPARRKSPKKRPMESDQTECDRSGERLMTNSHESDEERCSREVREALCRLVQSALAHPRNADGAFERFKSAVATMGWFTDDNMTALRDLCFGIAKDGSDVGLQIGKARVFLSDLTNQLEETQIPEPIARQFPELTQREWESAMRIITMILTAFEA